MHVAATITIAKSGVSKPNIAPTIVASIISDVTLQFYLVQGKCIVEWLVLNKYSSQASFYI